MTEPRFRLVAAYVAALHAHLGTQTPGRERLLAEAEDHLLEAVHVGLANGLGEAEAQRQAIARFGPPEVVANEYFSAYQLQPVFDARKSLPAGAAEELRRARRLALAPKTERLAVLGYWVPAPTATEPDAERFGAILVPSRRGGPLYAPLRLATFNDLDADGYWLQAIRPHLRGGMRVSVEPWQGELRIWFGPLEHPPLPGRETYFAFGRHDPWPPRQRLVVRPGPGTL